MIALALDTTTACGSVAVARDGDVVDERRGDGAIPHGRRLPGDVAALLAAHALAPADIDVYGVAAGPGSFTGLRVGIATIQGLALATGRRVVPVTTLEALAYAAQASVRRPPPGAIVAACMDAHRGQLFVQLFRRRHDAQPLDDAQPFADAWADAPGTSAARITEAAQGEAIWTIGDAAEQVRDAVAARGGRAEALPTPPLARHIARLATRRAAHGAVPPHAIRPVYVRRPDAEIARDRERGSDPLSGEAGGKRV